VRSYTFVSHWHIAASALQAEKALLCHEDWTKWWGGLEKVTLLDGRIGTGARFACVWNSGAGYTLRTITTITDYQPGKSVSFSSTGDLEGEGSFILEHASALQTDVVIHWNADVTKSWMRWLSPILRPIFTVFHHRLMRAGERGFNKYL
jgi:hypothetical protein